MDSISNPVASPVFSTVNQTQQFVRSQFNNNNINMTNNNNNNTKCVSFQEELDVRYIEAVPKSQHSKLYYEREDYELFEKREKGRLQRAYGRSRGRKLQQVRSSLTKSQEKKKDYARELQLRQRQLQNDLAQSSSFGGVLLANQPHLTIARLNLASAA